MSEPRPPLAIDADTRWLSDFRRERGDRHLLAMSRGKDAIATWLALRDAGFEVVPFHLYLVPDLEFVAESLAELERAFNTQILDLPHPSLFRMLDDAVFQPPERIAVIDQLNPKKPTFAQVYADVRKLSGAPASSLVASGVRACDSIVRRISFQKHGHIRPKTETFYPVWNFRKQDVLSIMARNGIHLPPEYAWFAKTPGNPATGRSFDGLDYRFLGPIKRHRPRDYARILEWFPLAELEVFRHERLSRSQEAA
jgi:hypothetical protein